MTPDEKLDALFHDVCTIKKQVTRPVTGPLGASGWARWILGIVGTLVAVGIGASVAFAISNSSRLAVVESKAKDAVAPERVAKVETQVDGLEKKVDKLDTKMDKANGVLGGLAERFRIKVESGSQ